jgi:acetoin utilization protein AcuB
MLTVESIMTPDPITVQPDTPLAEVIGRMKANDCRQMPVMAEGKLVGIISDRDIRLAMNSPLTLHERAQDQALLRDITAGTCMTPNPLTVEEPMPAVEAARLLKRYKFGGLPVMRGELLVGIVTVTDILNSYIGLLAVLGEKSAE